MHSPLLKNPGRASYDLFHVTDWFPTLAKLAGLSLNDTKLDGYNIWDTIRWESFEWSVHVWLSCNTHLIQKDTLQFNIFANLF